MKEMFNCCEKQVEENVKPDDRKIIAHIVMNVYDDQTVKFEMNGDMKVTDLTGLTSFNSPFRF